MKIRRFLKPLLVMAPISLLLTLTFCFAGPRGLPPAEGILNFGRINDGLYRGAQPDEIGIKNLKHLGIKMIINLRMPKEASKVEPAQAEANGIIYTNVPLTGLGRPTDSQISKILSLIESSPSPVFIHCEHGCDRTGTIIACYRIKHNQWTSASALQEADEYGMSKLERGMRRYIMSFARSTNKSSPPAAPIRP